uniref:O-acyltransferase WSD1 C-terminal domain-containing protein n=1 Tax=Anopheles quadriannulatus TaxID=34691 RepID=A0A182WZS4_ANOQN
MKHSKRIDSLLTNTVVLVGIILALPVIIAILVLFQVHRQIVAQLLAIKYGSSFRGLLQGADVVWAGQERSSKAVASVLLLFEKPVHVSDDSVHLLELFRDRFKRLQTVDAYQKLFWQRRIQWGYYFWIKQGLPLWSDRYVKQLDVIPTSSSCLSKRQLCALIGSISNRDCNGTSWELLVGRQPLCHDDSTVMLYPVLFRYHHSIADGIAIFRTFCKEFLDSTATAEEHVWNPNAANQTAVHGFFTWRNVFRMAYRGPRFLAHEILLKRECNPFYGPEPSNNKIVCWAGDHAGRPANHATPAISAIKTVKHLVNDCSFTDILLTAFATSLGAHCRRKRLPVPTTVTIGQMRRFHRESEVIQLRNRSTAVFKTLPIGSLSCGSSTIDRLKCQINAVKGPDDGFQASTDALITHLSVSYLPELLPASVVRALFARSKFSIALFNIPAFAGSVSLGRYILREATFWVPNIERNLFGLTLLTTDGRLQIGAIADRTIIKDEEELEQILNETLQELSNMACMIKCNEISFT